MESPLIFWSHTNSVSNSFEEVLFFKKFTQFMREANNLGNETFVLSRKILIALQLRNRE